MTDEKVDALSPEARGMYRELLDRQWINKGSIPADLPGIARTARCSLRFAEKFWPEVAQFFVQHSEGRLHNEHLSKLKAEAEKNFERRSSRGKKGAEARWEHASANGSSIEQALDKQSPSNAVAELSNGHNRTLPDQTVPTVQARPISEPYGFCQWFLRRGIELGVIGADEGAVENSWCLKNAITAKALLAAHPVELVQARGDRYLQGFLDGTAPEKCWPSVKDLAKFWNWSTLRAVTVKPRGDTAAEIEARRIRQEADLAELGI